MTTKFTTPGFLRARLSAGMAGKSLFLPFFERYGITVCHEKKFIWYRVAKVATRTIYDVFDKADLELINKRVSFYSNPASRCPDYFKFAFVRNPWDRLVSCWKDKVVSYNYFGFSDSERSKMKSFENFVAFLGGVDIERCDLHLRSQSKLVDVDNLDYIGRFESFTSDLHALVEKLELGEVKIRRLNASDNRKNYRKYYDEALRQKVASIYREDIEIFSYDF